MLGNLQYVSKENKKFYILYLLLLTLSYAVLLFTQPAFPISLTVLLVFFLVDLFLLSRSERKATKVILGDLLVYASWVLMLYVFTFN